MKDTASARKGWWSRWVARVLVAATALGAGAVGIAAQTAGDQRLGQGVL